MENNNCENAFHGNGGFLKNLTPIVRIFLILNISVFIIQSVCESILHIHFFMTTYENMDNKTLVYYSEFFKIFALYVPYLKKYFLISQFVTHQFLHGGIMHLIFNMLTLSMIGPFVERQIGSRSFIKLYLMGGIFAGFCNLLFVNSYGNSLVGASGAICSIFATFALMNPNMKLRLIGIPGLIKPMTILFIYAGITIILAVMSSSNIAHVAHLGGLLFGYLYFKNFFSLKRLID